MLKWIIENGCPYKPIECCEGALRGKRFEIMDWLMENGWVWEESFYHIAIRVELGNFQVVEGEGMSMGFKHIQSGCFSGCFEDFEVGIGEWMCLE